MVENQGTFVSTTIKMPAPPTAHVATSQDGLAAQLFAMVETLKQNITYLKMGNGIESSDFVPTTLPVKTNQTLATPTTVVSPANLIVAKLVGASNSNTFITRIQLQDVLRIETEKANKALVAIDFQPPYPISIV